MNLHRAWDITISEIRNYIKACSKTNKDPDYDMIKKYAHKRVRELYQEFPNNN